MTASGKVVITVRVVERAEGGGGGRGGGGWEQVDAQMGKLEKLS